MNGARLFMIVDCGRSRVTIAVKCGVWSMNNLQQYTDINGGATRPKLPPTLSGAGRSAGSRNLLPRCEQLHLSMYHTPDTQKTLLDDFDMNAGSRDIRAFTGRCRTFLVLTAFQYCYSDSHSYVLWSSQLIN